MGRNPLPPRGLTSISLDAAAEAFVAYARSRVGDESSTWKMKKFLLGHMADALGGDRAVFTLTPLDFEKALDYIYAGADEAEAQWRRENGKRPRSGRHTKGSQSQAKTTLRQFAEYCHLHQWLDSTVSVPSGEIVRSGKRVHGVTSPQERLPRDLWPVALQRAGELHMRTRMAVAIGLLMGRRVSEAVALQFKHVDFHNRNLAFWNQKAGRALDRPFLNGIEAEIRLWLDWARETYGEPQPDWYLVPSRIRPTGTNSYLRVWADPRLYPVDMTKRSSTETVIKDVRKVLSHFGIQKGTGNGTHTLRRSAATDAALSKGIYVAKILLDHQNVATTQAYIGVASDYEVLRDAYAEQPAIPVERDGNVIPMRKRATG